MGARWRARLDAEARPAATVAAAMDRTNPIYIPRNQLVEDALAAAVDGDLAPYEQLLDVVTHPFDERPGTSATPCPPTPAALPHVLRHLKSTIACTELPLEVMTLTQFADGRGHCRGHGAGGSTTTSPVIRRRHKAA